MKVRWLLTDVAPAKRFVRAPLLLLIIVLAALFALTSSPLVGASSVAGVVKLWSLPLNGGPGQALFDGGIIYVGTVTGSIYAINAADGTEIWSAGKGGFEGPSVFASSPCVANGVIYITDNDNGVLYALNGDSGSLIWMSTIEQFYGTPAYANGRLYVSYVSGHVVNMTGCLDALTGALLWSVPGSWNPPLVAGACLYLADQVPPGHDTLYAYDAASGAEVWSQYFTWGSGSIVVSGSTCFMTLNWGSDNDSLYAFDAITGRQIWSFKTDGAAGAAMVSGGMVYFSSNGGLNRAGGYPYIFALNSSTGSAIWRYTGDDATEWGPVVTGDKIFVGSGSLDGDICALDSSTGAKVWNYSTGTYWYNMALNGGEVDFLATQSGNLYALDASTGARLWSYPEPIGSGGLAVWDGRIYAFTSNTIYAFQSTFTNSTKTDTEISPSVEDTSPPVSSVPSASTPSPTNTPTAAPNGTAVYLGPSPSPSLSISPSPTSSPSLLNDTSPDPTAAVSSSPLPSSPSPSAIGLPFWLWILVAGMMAAYGAFLLVVDKQRKNQQEKASAIASK